jgi:hypothetical protein
MPVAIRRESIENGNALVMDPRFRGDDNQFNLMFSSRTLRLCGELFLSFFSAPLR